MKILLIGSGGREHALAWKLAQSENCTKVYCAPGNAGIAEVAETVDIAIDDIDGLVNFAAKEHIDLVVIGPEAPLVAGLTDHLVVQNIKVFGPTKAAAQLEGSKGFMKDFCAKYNIPTAAYGCFTDIKSAQKFIAETGAPIVVKADGLAAGKGVIICQTEQEAIDAAEGMLSGSLFGQAGQSIVIEEFLDGQELSFFALADGRTFVPLASAQDHKRAYDGDKGPNTGGMGTYSPACMMTDDLEQKIIDRIIKPTIEGMAAEGSPFTGVLFAGIMMVGGEPVLLEFNTRFGDPECQALMMRMNCDLLQILTACAEGRLAEVKDSIIWSPDPAICVVMAAEGYPGAYAKGSVISGLITAEQSAPDVRIFHAGTGRDENGQFISTGGRVLGVAATGKTIEFARSHAYDAIDHISWPQGFCRHDIGWQAVDAVKQRKSGT